MGAIPNARSTWVGVGSDAGRWIRLDGVIAAAGVLTAVLVTAAAGGAAVSLLTSPASVARLELETVDALLPDDDIVVAVGVSELAAGVDDFFAGVRLAAFDFATCRPEWPLAGELEDVLPLGLPEPVSAYAVPEPVARAAPTPRLNAPTPSQE